MTGTLPGSEQAAVASSELLNERGRPTQPSQKVQMHTVSIPYNALHPYLGDGLHLCALVGRTPRRWPGRYAKTK